MSHTHSYQFRRDDGPALDPKSYYTMNNFNLPTHSLSAGIYLDTDGAINMTTRGAYSSENWQFFFQSGCYFIRNYDYGAKWQLGLTADSRSTPKLYPRSGNLSQQWTLTKADGGWEMTNGLWGDGTTYALPKNWPLPVMRSEADGTVWNITSNPSAAKLKPLTGDMLSPVDNVEKASTSTSILPSATSSDSNSRFTGLPSLEPIASTGSNALTTSLSFSSSMPTSMPNSSAALSGGAIAGIVIGSLALFSALILSIWFFLVKRKQRRQPYQHGTPVECHGTSAPAEKYAHDAAELSVPPAELAALSDKQEAAALHRAELDSSSNHGPRI